MSREEFALITGATSGIGRSLAEEFARNGYSLLLVSRNTKKLEEIKFEIESKNSVQVKYFPLDLSNIDSIDALKEFVVANKIHVNILINNAGSAQYGPMAEIDFQEQRRIMNLNMLAMVRTVDLFLPILMQNKESRILNVASIAALYPLPYNGIYGATKAFVLSFSKALRYELVDTGVSVSCLCPGDTRTNFFKNAGNENPNRKLMSPELVAKQAFVELFKGVEVIFSSNVNMLAKLPRFILEKGIKKMIEKSRKLTSSST